VQVCLRPAYRWSPSRWPVTILRKWGEAAQAQVASAGARIERQCLGTTIHVSGAGTAAARLAARVASVIRMEAIWLFVIVRSYAWV
jgi:hypothetical protein